MTESHTSLRSRTHDALYDLIRSRPACTRSELVQRTGMSRSTVDQAVRRLLTAGRITESGAEDKGRGSGSGRPGLRLTAVSQGRPVAGIDFGHNHVLVAIADDTGTVLREAQERLDVDLHADAALDLAVAMLRELQRACAIDQFAAVVAGIPGPVDATDGLVRSPTILSSWVGMAPARELQQRLHVPVHVENDAVLGAVGELCRGAGKPFDNFLYLKASNGIGAALVVNGRPYRGNSGIAGEIGHTHLPGNAELCRCGNRGCLEAAVSTATLRTRLAHTRPGIQAADIDLSTPGDTIADRMLNEAGRTIGEVVADYCNLLNPAAVILGGELGTAGPEVIDGVASSIRRHAQPAIADALCVAPAALGVRAEITGALVIAARVDSPSLAAAS